MNTYTKLKEGGLVDCHHNLKLELVSSEGKHAWLLTVCDEPSCLFDTFDRAAGLWLILTGKKV